MPNYCAVSTCNSRSRRRKDSKLDLSTSLSFFSFPRDTELRDKWIKACGREDDFNPDISRSRICSEHFRDTDFVRDLKAELLGYDPKGRFLKQGSVPSVNVSLEPEERDTFRRCSPNVCEHSCRCCRPKETCEHSCEFCRPKETKRADKYTNTTDYKCLSCFLLQREINFCKKKMKPLLSYAKVAECRFDVMRKKIARIEAENKVLKRQLKQYENSKSTQRSKTKVNSN